MKILGPAVVAAGCWALSSQTFAAPPEVSPEILLRRIASTYAEAKSYSDNGVVYTYDSDDTPRYPYFLEFHIRFVRPNLFRFDMVEAEDDKRGQLRRENRKTLWSDDSGTYDLWENVFGHATNSYNNITTGVCSFTGISSRAVHNIPSLFAKKFRWQELLTELPSPKIVGEETFEGVPCYRIKGAHKGNRQYELWFGKSDYLLRKIKTVYSAFWQEEIHRHIQLNKNIPEDEFTVVLPEPKEKSASRSIASDTKAAEPAESEAARARKEKELHEKREREEHEKEIALVKEIHRKIVAESASIPEAKMTAYTNIIHVREKSALHPIGEDVFALMLPIPGGEFTMGSPATERGHQPDESPHRVKVSAFWIGQCEVTWDEYEPFIYEFDARKRQDPTYTADTADLVAKPSKPYVEMSFGMGKSGYPAIGMTQHAANKYCEWLSAHTGHFYRLPTEAEWEYACRAGSSTAYSFGDDAGTLDDYAWFADNSLDRNVGDRKYHKVGKKKPNAWGLHDMHGNVAEWCLDQYDPTFYFKNAGKVWENPWNKATKPYPHVVRGGAWDEVFGQPQNLRSAARGKSDKEWKKDVQLPPSFWYMYEGKFVGFRVVRPLMVPSTQEMFDYWNSGVENDLASERRN